MSVRRILIDGTMARRGGGFTYLVNIVPRLADLGRELRFLLLTRNPALAGSIPTRPNLEVRDLPSADLKSQLASLAGRLEPRVRAWAPDVYFSAGEYAPVLSGTPVVASFRNANIFTALHQGWPLRQRVRLRVLRSVALRSARHCARVVFVSDDSARWMGERAGVPPERRWVVHHGVDPLRFQGLDAPRPLARPYLLSVSSIYRYKNYLRLIEAYLRLASEVRELPDLVILGDDQDPPYARAMRALRASAGPLSKRIHLLGEVPYEQVAAWYVHAFAFVFPSYLETFGHPLLEALASGLAVLAADIGVFREIAGNAALYADPFNVAAIQKGLGELLGRPGPGTAATARARAGEFSWGRSAAALLERLRTLD